MNRVAKILEWTVIAMVAAVIIVYGGDYLSIRYRMSHKASKPPFAVLKFRPTYAIPQKDGKDEFDFGDPETETCVHSLLPHFGYRPCWYASKEVQKPIVVDGR